MAISSPGNEGVRLTLTAYEKDGTTPAAQDAAYIPAGGHLAQFAGEWISSLPGDYVGVPDVTSDLPFVAVTLRSFVNTSGDYLSTAFPVADCDQTAPAPVVFPQIADGGGYQTQFVFVGGAADASASILFRDDQGAPLNVVKK